MFGLLVNSRLYSAWMLLERGDDIFKLFFAEATRGGIELVHSSAIYPGSVGLIHVNRESLFTNSVVLFAPGWFDIVI